MNIKTTFNNRITAFSVVAVVAALLTASTFTMPAAIYAQLTTGGGAATTTTTPTQNATTTGGSPLTFTLRTGDGGATGGAAAATTGNATTKNISIMVNLTRGSEPPIQLPINATIPANVNSLDLCVSGMDIPETCQPVWSANTTNATAAAGTTSTIDLTQNATGGTAAGTTAPTTATPSSYAPTMTTPSLVYTATTGISSNSAVGRFIPVSGSLIGIEDTTVNIPITVIAPITVQVQNAQVCAQLLSSGTQECNQIILNPEQTAYTPVDVDLASPTPTVTPESGETTDTTAPTTTTTPTQEPTTDNTTTTAPTDTTGEAGTPTTGEETGTTTTDGTETEGGEEGTTTTTTPEGEEEGGTTEGG